MYSLVKPGHICLFLISVYCIHFYWGATSRDAQRLLLTSFGKCVGCWGLNPDCLHAKLVPTLCTIAKTLVSVNFKIGN